jgi:hypothetical protein
MPLRPAPNHLSNRFMASETRAVSKTIHTRADRADLVQGLRPTATSYDGADIVHLILKQHERIDWRRLLGYMDLHWEVLLVHLLNFRWAYPSEREHVPRWLMDELLGRLERQLDLPSPRVKICRGRMLSRIDYESAVKEWGFADVGEESE